MTTISAASQLRSWLRMGLAATSACLGMGLAMWLLWAGPGSEVGTAMIWIGLAILVLIPVLNVVAVLLDEWSAKPRTFAMAAIAVLVLLIVSTVYKLR
jgi:uncharacterized membrane protein